ncbi:MAG: hypothetical protein J5979_00340 [Lachnospiraceae bacterium]|nr:hypothetical protein [Lachnospiraceae bacterium]
MNTIQKSINLNLGQPNNEPLLQVMQGDNDSIEIVATLYNAENLYTINADLIVLSGTTPSGKIIENTIEDHTDHTVTFPLTKNMLAADGILNLSVVLMDSTTNQVLSSFPFTIEVMNAPVGSIPESELTAITDYVFAARDYSVDAKEQADRATAQADTSETKAMESAYYASNAAASEANAKTSETSAKASENNAKESETNAKTSEDMASVSADTASAKAEEAANSAALALSNASSAATFAATAITNATHSAESATLAKSYAAGGTGTRENEDTDNAKYYKEQAQSIAEGLEGGLLPMGTIPFNQLSSQPKQPGYLYNISDAFTTDDTFKEGEGHTCPEGTNVYYTADGFWDCLAGTCVAGVKGNAESVYRKGNVNITPADIGLGNVNNTADANKNVKHADTATKATQDNDGKQINTTYAKKTELPVIDSALSTSSTNPVQNKTITSAIFSMGSSLANKAEKSTLTDFLTVESYETTISIGANSATTSSFSITPPSGYSKALGIIDVLFSSTYAKNVVPYYYSISGSKIGYAIGNCSNSSVSSVKVTFKVLFAKS